VKSLSVAFSLILVGCGSLPPRPNVALCTMDWPRQQSICYMTGETVNDVHDLAPEVIRARLAGDGVKIPLAYMDRAIMFAPKDWQTVSDYLKKLREVAERQCGTR